MWLVGTGRLVFSLDYTQADFDAVGDFEWFEGAQRGPGFHDGNNARRLFGKFAAPGFARGRATTRIWNRGHVFKRSAEGAAECEKKEDAHARQ